MKTKFPFSGWATVGSEVGCIFLCVLLGVSFVTPAKADKIGINFVGGSQPDGTPAPIKPDELAGPFLQKFWNNAYEKSGTLSPAGDNEKGSSASYTGFSVNWTAFQTNTKPIAPYLGPGYGIEGPPDYRLGLGFLDATANQPATVTLTGIPAQFSGSDHSYSLVVFFSLDNVDFDNRTTSDNVNIFTVKGAKVGQRTICGLQPSGAKPPLQGWVEVPETSTTDKGVDTPAGNYVVFSRLTDTDITLTATGGFASDGNSRAAINFIQIIPDRTPALLNISTRGRVGTGDDVLIAGFIIGTDQPQRVVVRALGPSVPIANTLADPKLEVHDASGNLIAQNDNWLDAPDDQPSYIYASGLAPPNDRESAVSLVLDPGTYTAIVSGVGNSTGIALVEVYNVR
jgi:hypothetical protein